MYVPPVPSIPPTRLEIPASTANRPRGPTTPSQRLPPTALFHGPHSRNASHISINAPEKQNQGDKPQHLPRADPPTRTFSAGRPSLVGQSRLQQNKNKDEDFRADALWVEMQKTLADVELSAMNSSHVFSASHARALEELRTAQLGLAQAWAKSEAEELADEEFRNEESEVSTVGQFKQRIHGGTNTSPNSQKKTSRPGSSSSAAERTLEEETEKDILLARKRREANDRYFEQVNKGVLAVVSKLDDVANAMRRVEKESRDIWDESSAAEFEDATETEKSPSAGETDTDAMADSPARTKR